MSAQRENGRFFLLQGLYWAAYCVLFGYTVTIFGAYGYSAQVCGILTTLQYVVLLVAQPIYGYLMDNIVSPKWFFVGLSAAAVVGAFFLPWAFAQSQWVVIGYFLLLSLFNFCGSGVVDTWCIEVANEVHGTDYGLMRSGGSIFYAITGLVAGYIIAPLGIRSLFFIHAALCGLGLLLALGLPDPWKLQKREKLPHEDGEHRPSFASAVLLLMKNRAFVVYTLCMTCYYFASRATQVYMPLVLGAAGGDASHYGLSVFIASGGEMLVMLWASRLLVRGWSMENLFGIAMGFFTVRFFLLALCGNLWVILAGQVLLAVGFGLQIRVNTQYLSHITPEGYHGTAILLSGSLSSGIGAMLGNYCGGFFIDDWGIRPYLLLCALVFLAGFLLFVPTLVRVRRRNRAALAEALHPPETF